MNDRDLLELAAKAAGYEVRWHENWQCFVHVNPHNIDNPPTLAGQRLVWVPLNDDGDALRLAVKLRLDVEFIEECDTAYVSNENHDVVVVVAIGDIELRRAIVRAAAAIGQAMK